MKREWIFFWIVAVIWGSSFLFMRIGVEEVPPAQLAFTRIGIAAVCMNIVLFFTGRRYPRDWNTLVSLVVLGIVNTGIPFTLLAWGEQTVESGLTSILQAITPVFALVIAHFAFADERITPMKIAGITISFVGILVLTRLDNLTSVGDLGGEIAILVASLCYAIGTNYSRRMLRERGIDSIVVSTVTMTGATVATFILMYALPLIGERIPVDYTSFSPEILQILFVLGFLNTFLAYLMFYAAIGKLGGARASMVTYVVPVVAVTLGAVFLNEVIDARLIFGSALILLGLALVNGWLNWLINPQKLNTKTATSN